MTDGYPATKREVLPLGWEIWLSAAQWIRAERFQRAVLL